MLNYLTNVTYIMAKKLHGKSIEDDEAIGEIEVLFLYLVIVSCPRVLLG